MPHKLTAASLTLLRLIRDLQIEGRQANYPSRRAIAGLMELHPDKTELQIREWEAAQPKHHREIIRRAAGRVRFNPVPRYLIVAEMCPISRYGLPKPTGTERDRLATALAELGARELIESMPLEADDVSLCEYKRPDGTTIEVRHDFRDDKAIWLRVDLGEQSRNPLSRPGCSLTSVCIMQGRCIDVGYRIKPSGIQLLDEDGTILNLPLVPKYRQEWHSKKGYVGVNAVVGDDSKAGGDPKYKRNGKSPRRSTVQPWERSPKWKAVKDMDPATREAYYPETLWIERLDAWGRRQRNRPS